ncbi:MAG TPA: pitrilysin family protein [Candidatus Kapabacteria bacterium]|nr:pitrilysin family protein [Candidatus Kapabacteria bacterium]
MLYPIRKCHAIVAGLSLATALTVNAQTSDLPKVNFTKFELPNGLRVILSVDKTAPVVATFVHYHVGSKNERPDRTGFAHFFEHLMFEGTEHIARHSIDKIVQSAGGRLNAFTTFDETGYQIELPSNQLKLALWLESERMMHARVEEIGVETQRGVVKEERKNRYDNTPYGSVLENLAKYVAEGTPYSWTPIGSVQYIDQARIEEFRDFYKTYYVPNNAVLAIVGDIDVERTKQLVKDYFAGIARGKDIVRPQFQLEMGKSEKIVDVREDNTPLPALLYAYRTPKRGDHDAYAIEVLATILATGNSSRLYQNMIDQHQLAVGVQAFPFDLELGGLMGLFAVSHPTVSMDQLGTAFNHEIENVQQNGVTDEEFTKALNQLETQFARRFNDDLDKAQALATYETFFNDPGVINTEFERYTSLTRDDIQRVAKKYLVPENRVILKYYPAAKGGH